MAATTSRDRHQKDMPMKLALVTDAWEPQVNGVVTTLSRTRDCLTEHGDSVLVLSSREHSTLPLPTYPEIRIALRPYRRLARAIDDFEPDAIHIATEGPLGIAARRYCKVRNLAFSTSYHTQFPEYVRKRLPIPLALTYAWLRRFHGRAASTLVATAQQQQLLQKHRFRNVVLWSRGVDTSLFRPCGRDHLALPRPIWMYVGRIAIEKNLEAFLDLPLPGTRVLVGDGPDRARLARRYHDAHFAGYRFGNDLARHLSSADVFVFPSRTDTFGLVMLEAMACGTPVAAFPVTGPIDVVQHQVTGVLDEDLGHAARAALEVPRENCRAFALRHSWEAATTMFRNHLVDARTGVPLTADV